MDSASLPNFFRDRYGEAALTLINAEAFKVEAEGVLLYGLISDDRHWFRLLAPVTSLAEAKPFLEQILRTNFEQTDLVRYAVDEDVLWLVFQQLLEPLEPEELEAAIASITELCAKGVNDFFARSVETQVKQIILANKMRGQSLEATLQTLEHFYREGVMGGLDQSASQREATLQAWRYQLTRFWDTVEPASAVPDSEAPDALDSDSPNRPQ